MTISLNLIKNTREDFRNLVTYKDFSRAMYLSDCVRHFIRFGEADKAYKSARELARVFLPFLNRPYLKFRTVSKEE